jgi:oligoribonuclease
MEKLLWIDMEMTGLDVKKEVPIEIAAIVTDFDFQELEIYHSVIQQDKKYLDAMDEWNKKHHGESGLTEAVSQGKDSSLVQKEMVQLIQRHFQEPAIIAGNSIGQDRTFIDHHLPTLAAKLHYRMLDVSSWKVVMNKKYQHVYKKKNAHRAVDDIRESISELKFYLESVNLPKK